MIITYLADPNMSNAIRKSSEPILDAQTLWIDLFNISPAEEQLIESFLAIDIPTREEMQQIEVSNRLYIENNALYLTVVYCSETEDPANHLITFILHQNRLITVRYTDLKPFYAFIAKMEKAFLSARLTQTSSEIFTGLIAIIVERLADVLEQIKHEVNESGRQVFSRKTTSESKINYQTVLEKISSNGILISKCRESLVSLVRAVNYCLKSSEFSNAPDGTAQLNNILSDVNSLSNYADFLSTEIRFLLDATLGMIGIEQNNIIKMFSVVTVVFLPPTLIASIYGMNFARMPELHYSFGYPLALMLMIFSAWLPYKFFKKRKWL